MKKDNKRYFAIDLFAGSGGLSEGFRQAGFEVIAQVEMDRWACQTLKTRCLYYKLKERQKLYWYFKYSKNEITKDELYKRFPDIKKEVDLEVIKAEFGEDDLKEILNRIEDVRKYHEASKFHVVLGGPPCQPYSLAGTARRNFEKIGEDHRHLLYKYYLEILKELQPDIFVYENVPGMIATTAKGRQIFQRVLNDFQSLGPSYNITPPLDKLSENPASYILNSAHFGVPQNRKRIILIGYRSDLLGRNQLIEEIFSVIQKKAGNKRRRGKLTVDDAIGDLPHLKPGEGNDSWFGLYNEDADLKSYQIAMRKGSPGILNHKARTHMKSDLERYRFFIEYLDGNKAATLTDLMRERPDLTPAHNHLDKFLDRFKVQRWCRPASTITAHICKDGHYYIHPDISQCRSFTVREAARCQSFLDNFKFEGPRTEQFRQVGNAVPPLLARTIARDILQELKQIYDE